MKNIEISDLELNRKEKLYAADAFKLIEENYKNVDIFFIMGADNFINIVKWKNSKEIIEKYNYIVLDRNSIDLNRYINENEFIRSHKDNIKVIKDENYSKYNATDFRNKIKKDNEYNQEIVSDEVIDYIIENGLYK